MTYRRRRSRLAQFRSPVPPFLGTLAPKDIGSVMGHRAQQSCVQLLAALIEELRSCRTVDQLDDFQRRLFQHLFAVQTHQGEVHRCQKRLRPRQALGLRSRQTARRS